MASLRRTVSGVLSVSPVAGRGHAQRLAAPLVFLLAVAVLREVSGRGGSGIAALVLLPVLWVAARGSRRELAVVLLGVGAVFILPSVALGQADELAASWPVAAFVVAASSIAGLLVHQLVAQVREQAHEAVQRQRELEILLEMMRELAAAEDARAASCDAARVVARAPAAVLFELDREGRVVATAAVGASVEGLLLPRDSSGALGDVLRTGRGMVLDDPAAVLDVRVLAALGAPSSVVLEPVVGPGVTGVLAVALPHTAGRRGETLALLAAEAASAIGRADVVAELESQARIDPLTGLPNRRAWDEALRSALGRAARDGQPICVAVLDLDGFKAFNDTHGHQAGDRALKAVAAAWRAEVREGDLLARWGGDEFALLVHAPASRARHIVERVRSSVADRSASFGIAQWDGAEDAERVLARADAALYAAKTADAVADPRAES